MLESDSRSLSQSQITTLIVTFLANKHSAQEIAPPAVSASPAKQSEASFCCNPALEREETSDSSPKQSAKYLPSNEASTDAHYEERGQPSSKDDYRELFLHQRARVECELCGKFFLKSSLSQHKYQKHPNTSRAACKVCGVQIFNFQMQAHLTKEHGVRPECRVCGKKLHPGSVKRHMINVHGLNSEDFPTKFDCLLCGSNQLVENLSQHNARHHACISQDQKIYLRVGCQKCGKVMLPDDLDDHLLEHQAEAESRSLDKKPCGICKREFTKASMEKHMKWMHPETLGCSRKRKQMEKCSNGVSSNPDSVSPELFVVKKTGPQYGTIQLQGPSLKKQQRLIIIQNE